MRPPRGPKGPRFEPRELGDRKEVILNQQYVEVVDSGDPASSFVQLDQQYIEVVCTFGTPAVAPPKKDPPGKVKKQQMEIAVRYRTMVRRHRNRYGPRFPPVAGWAPVPAAFIAASNDMPRYRNFRRVISAGNDGHTVRIREG